ncbi:MAG: hypothetical protein CUN49_13010 [Candidatus Thermofonsia Clade 1 bacterium]|jgi:hypothetical protein|uniref:Uncharacterized protein n=1 Tax=Candidatus Thermofonsia Clade 1 bacterium TaxID=2364210 RepID=A0A2M8Q0S8_9CHLR|nr:MAG: hypothetical protein CUN49_13010 [Candidatus Thermofonsia Clade 1 bacterium]PJF43401.1 MAG: hypothetical protein CUN50_00315 [Candidatus Thermofonsia Clade 1 bacterium]RMF51444.1 MAG: hypothetical protein D6749_07795 [Chloroflexota bacterium]
MEGDISSEQLERVREWLQRRQGQLRQLGLDDLMALLVETPLGFIASQMLLLFQPVLGKDQERSIYESLARLLSTPEGTSWLRQQLIDRDEEGGRR